MADSECVHDEATLTVPLLPVELALCDHYGRETRFIIHKLPAIVGRDEGADVRLMDPWISHRHCQIDQIGNVLVVRDFDSKNGIFLHGHHVRESHLMPGDHLTIGRTEVIVRYHSTEQTAKTSDIEKPPRKKPSKARPSETLELLY